MRLASEASCCRVGKAQTRSKLFGFTFGPPLAEQHRIVARVEQLRRLCADLRERLQQARATPSRLADALVTQDGYSMPGSADDAARFSNFHLGNG